MTKENNTINDRVKLIRKQNNLTMEAFGKKIGVTKASISTIESGKNGVSNRMAIIICKTFNVNEDWLLNGNGEMFIKKTKDEAFYEAIANIDYHDDELIKQIIISYVELPDECKEAFKKFLYEVVENTKKSTDN